jgi:hypothetical protein
LQIPIESGGVMKFTPSSLEHLVPKPVIRLRWGERRHKEMVNVRQTIEDAQPVSTRVWRKTFLEGYLDGWGQEKYDLGEPFLKQYWDEHDQWLMSDDDDFKPSAMTADEYEKIVDAVFKYWKPMRAIKAQNDKAEVEKRYIEISLVVMGWSGIDLPLNLEGGAISVDDAYLLANKLQAMEFEAHKADKDFKPSAAWDLYIKCNNRLYLPAETEKNSPSPVPSPATQSDLEIGQVSQNGPSKASGDSPKTPDTELIPVTSD